MQTKDRKSRSIRAALVLVVVGVIGSWCVASAGETDTFGLSPHPEFKQGNRRSLRYGLAPGSTATDSVRVYNKTDRKLRLVVHALDASKSADGTIQIPPTGTAARSVGSWIDLAATEVELGPKQERVLSFTITRPEARGRGGLAAIVAEEADSNSRAGESVEIVTRVALLVQVGNISDADVFVHSVSLEPTLTFFPARAKVSAVVSNQTDDAMKITIGSEVRSISGRRFKLEAQTIDLGPNQTRRVVSTWETVPRFGGFMRATVRASYREAEVSSRSSMALIVPIWLLATVIVVEASILWRRLRRGV